MLYAFFKPITAYHFSSLIFSNAHFPDFWAKFSTPFPLIENLTLRSLSRTLKPSRFEFCKNGVFSKSGMENSVFQIFLTMMPSKNSVKMCFFIDYLCQVIVNSGWFSVTLVKLYSRICFTRFQKVYSLCSSNSFSACLLSILRREILRTR